MFYLLLLLSFIAMATGVFVVGLGIPIRETFFGAALLIAGSVALTGGLILVGLAAAVRELRRMVHGLKARSPGPRPVRHAERRDGERIADSDRRPEPRLPMPGALGAEALNVIPTKLDAPDTRGWSKPGPEWLRRAVAEIEADPPPAEAPPQPAEAAPQPAEAAEAAATADDYRAEENRRLSEAWLHTAAAQPPDHAATEVRQTPAVPSPNLFDTMWPSKHRTNVEVSEQQAEAAPEIELRPAEAKSPPLAPAPPQVAPPVRPVRVEPRPLPVLKSGVIDKMAYTLFTDGSIEAKTPEGTVRFGSIEELRKYIDSSED